MELRTPRLLLRPITLEDAEMIQEYRGDPRVVTWLTHPDLDLDHTSQHVARAVALWSGGGQERFNLLFAVVLDGAVIGDVHAWNAAEPLQPASPDPGEVWIGYALNPRHQGCGYATEAIHAMLTWLFGRGVHTVFANCYLENTPSIEVLERLGFEEHLRYSAEQDESGKHAASCRMRLNSRSQGHS